MVKNYVLTGFCLFVFNSIICGLTQFTNKNHIAFAALEAVCFQTREVRTNLILNSLQIRVITGTLQED